MGLLLRDHMIEVENVLLAQSRIPAYAGYSIHKV
jgi:hypothetical protein